MKQLFNIITYFLFMLSILVLAPSCTSSGSGADNSSSVKGTNVIIPQSHELKVYYFHANRRCATCEAVEAVSKEVMKEYDGGKVTFEAINRDEDTDNPLLKAYEISGQTLIVVRGDKKVDLTNEAFLNARSNPDKFKCKLKETIDSMM